MNETEFHRLADIMLTMLADGLEEADSNGLLEAEYQGGILTIQLSGGKQWIVSKHTPSKQLWLSSPVSGGLHFDYDEMAKDWKLSSGKHLKTLLFEELNQKTGGQL